MTSQKPPTRSINGQRWLGFAFIAAAVIVAAIAASQWLNAAPIAPVPAADINDVAEVSPSPSPTPRAITREPLIPTSARVTPTVLLPATPARATRTATATATAAAKIAASATAKRSADTSSQTTRTPSRTTTHAATRAVTRAVTRTAMSAVTRTATHIPANTATQTQAPLPTHTATPVPTIAATAPPPPSSGGAPYSTRRRICVSVPYNEAGPAGLGELKPGWYLNWTVQASPYRPAGAEFAQMVRVSETGPRLDLATLASLAQQNPGALWLIGNEMDVKWQDNVTAERYAAIYHDVYAAIKQADPASRIAIGGVSQPTALRLQYLDRVLAAYRQAYQADMPIDVWNVHNFILQEKRGDWGVDIPPGMGANSGQLYSIDEHGSLDIFKQQLYAFRQWMAQHGYRNKELIVTEYGILMPADYGFDAERVRDFMIGTFDFMRTATSGATGLPTDGNRLVQRWCWYSLTDNIYPTGNLLDFNSQELTPLGRDFKAYLESH